MFSLMESALDAVGASDDLLDEATLAIREADLHRRSGRVVDLIGLITEATGLHPNIDFALAVAMHALGLPIGYELSLFAISRTAGWIAHAIEQLHSGGLIRPRARYTGPAPSRSGTRRNRDAD